MAKTDAEIIAELRAELKKRDERIASLEADIAALKALIFSKKGERHPKAAADDKISPSDEEKKRAAELKRKARAINRSADKLLKKPSEQGSTVNLEEIRRRVPLGLECSSCGGEVRDMGVAHEAHETHIELAKIIERTFKLHRGECGCGSVSFIMPGPDRALDKTTFSPALIAKVISDKFRYHMPIHRQEQFFADHGLRIPRQTLNDLVLRCATQLKPLVARMHERNRSQELTQADESPCCIVKEKSKSHYLWCMLSSLAITFKFTEKRNQSEAADFLGPQTDTEVVVTDGHSAYGRKVIKKTRAMCMAHARRGFFLAVVSFPEVCLKVLNMFRDLYAVERAAIDLTPESRRDLRQQQSAPILKSLREYLKGLDPPKRSSLAKAVNYTLNHWDALTIFVNDGRVPIDNSAVEREFKVAKLGFKNFLFAQSDLGAEAVAIFYSIFATTKLHDVDPELYLADVLVKIQKGWPQSRIDELLPWNWLAPTTDSSGISCPLPDSKEEILTAIDVVAARRLSDAVIVSHTP